MLLNCGRHAVVATSKKNACVSLVFSFLYKVVQVSQATGAPEGCWSPWLCCVPSLTIHPRAAAFPGSSETETPGSGIGGLQLPCVWDSVALFAPHCPGEGRKVNRRKWGSEQGCPLTPGGAGMPPS